MEARIACDLIYRGKIPRQIIWKLTGDSQRFPFPAILTCHNVLYHTLMKTVGDGTKNLIIAPSADFRPAALFAPTPKAAKRVLEFFTAQINNAHTRRAYMNATQRFADCALPKKFTSSPTSNLSTSPLLSTTCRTSYRHPL